MVRREQIQGHLQTLTSVQQAQNSNAFHHTGCRVAQKLAPGFQTTVDPDVVLRRHEEVARFGWMMRCLLRDIVTLGAIWIVPVSREDLSKNWVERLLYAPTRPSAGACGREEHT
jgi:hypothetical protein